MGGANVLVLPPQKIMSGKTASGSYVIVPPSLAGQYVEATYYVVWDSTAAAGAVVVETCHDPTYSGTWANLGTANFSSASAVSSISVSGVFIAVRVRISSAVTSGTVDVWAVAANA